VHDAGSHGELGNGLRTAWTDELFQIQKYSSASGTTANNEDVSAKFVAAGPHYSAITASSAHGTHELYTFGSGIYYRLGHGTTNDCLVPTRVEAFVGSADSDCDNDGEESLNEKIEIERVACGVWHMVAVTKGMNDIYSW
jgi:alpha-tubulin suppressor-like RCC1 family protein